MRRAALFTLIAVALGGGHAQAQPAPAVLDAAKELVGGWELSNADHDRRCTITLSTDTAPGGFRLALDPPAGAHEPLRLDQFTHRTQQEADRRIGDFLG